MAERAGGVKVLGLHDLQGVSSMLAERVVEWTQQWKEEGRQEGKQEGIQEGKQQGEANLLIRLLARRFGPLSDEVVRRVRQADPETLMEWGDRVLTAERLEDVIGTGG